MAVTGTWQLKDPSHTGHSCHHSPETLPAMPNTGSTAENCTFLKVFHLCPKYHENVDATARKETDKSEACLKFLGS